MATKQKIRSPSYLFGRHPIHKEVSEQMKLFDHNNDEIQLSNMMCDYNNNEQMQLSNMKCDYMAL